MEYKKGCGKLFNHKVWGERICGQFEDLKHSDHYIYCEDCNNNQQSYMVGGKPTLKNENSGRKSSMNVESPSVETPQDCSGQANVASKEDNSNDTLPADLNLAYFCMGPDCNQYLGHRGFCSTKCHDGHYGM